MAIVGGYNVYPREIDEVLFSHPAVIEAATVGVPDSYRGELIHAYVVLRKGVKLSSEFLILYCKKNLAKYKVPSKITLINELPKTNIGKIDKGALRKKSREYDR